MGSGQPQGEQRHLKPFIEDANGRRHLYQEADGFSRLDRAVVGLCTLPRQRAIDLTQDARSGTGRQLASAGAFHERPGLPMSRIPAE
jgi:hypothetical protein